MASASRTTGSSGDFSSLFSTLKNMVNIVSTIWVCWKKHGGIIIFLCAPPPLHMTTKRQVRVVGGGVERERAGVRERDGETGIEKGRG